MEKTAENRSRAERFVTRLEADGETRMMGALMHALTKVLPDRNVDTIFLSDGEPNNGTPAMGLDIVRKIHQLHAVRFNTASIGEELSGEFGKPSLLQEMAQLTGGVFTRPK